MKWRFLPNKSTYSYETRVSQRYDGKRHISVSSWSQDSFRSVITEDVQRDAKGIFQTRKGHEEDGYAIQEVLEGSNMAENEVKEPEVLIFLLEKRLGWETGMLSDVSGE